jgi:tetratricopeptide (TPR) repeat protein
MAIAKIEKKKVELTKEALFQLIGAGVLAVTSLVLGWVALTNWRAKSSILSGYQLYDGNQAGQAKRELTDAAHLKPDHIGTREVLAKLACDLGELSAAEEHYRKIREVQREAGSDSTALKIGMGVVYLKMADKATATKEIQDLVEKARAEFRAATNVPEGDIGLGHCELVLASKTGNPKNLAAAGEIFKRVRTALNNHDTAAKISRDGLIDYYSGLGRVLSSSDKLEDLREAREAFQSCVQLARRWEVPRSNMLLAEARRWTLWNGTAAEMNALEPEVTQFRKTLGSYWKDSRDSNLITAHRVPWMIFSVAFAQALARSGNTAAAGAIFADLRGTALYNEMPDPLLLESRFRCELALKEGLKPGDQDNAVREALAVFDPLLKRLGTAQDETAKDRRARTLNNLAVMRALQGTPGYKIAQDQLNDALKLYPDDYVFNRNLALVMKRAKAPAAGLQAALDKAKAAATGKFAEDFEKVQKVIEDK